MSFVQTIRERLAAIEPSAVEVTDESGAHVGHEGAREGGHYNLTVVSARFRGLSRIERHRLVYAQLGGFLGRGIHALGIRALTPEER